MTFTPGSPLNDGDDPTSKRRARQDYRRKR